MRAAIVVAPGRVEVDECALPEPGPGQARIRLEGCGVCASNVPPWEGRPWFAYPMPPGALGHEGWGVIDALGPGMEAWREGERVAFLSDRSYAEFDLAAPGAMVRLPPQLAARPFPGEPLGCAMNIFRRSRIAAGQVVAIVGIGFLGALLTRLASQAGARVLACARRAEALETAMAMGAGAAALLEDSGPQGPLARAAEITGGKFCDVVIECTGKQSPLDLSARLCRERGTLVIAGYHQDGIRQVDMQLWNWRGIDVINAHEREASAYLEGMAAAVGAVDSGRIVPEPLYTHRLPLHRLGEALDLAGKRPAGFMKALITF
jgi:threonine dehydrogenase-like Zn-dependent dehydrogenase